ncbi:hypothetical protein BGX26_009507 [Mortierella sp. AD094]|nr:hypothetical protein BGX26_009507 [Mortierella sp. AD094]
MKDDIVVDRSPLVDQYLPPKPKPSPSASSSSSSQGNSRSSAGQGEGLTKKQVLLQNNIALHKKYEAMVLDWTLILCDPVDENTLGEAANRIKQSHYEEIIDERNIGNLCGYPLCSQPPRDLKGKFRISLSERKVFDISELKREFHAQRAKDAPKKEEKPTPAFSLPLLSSPTSESATASFAPSQKLSHSLENEYVQTILASVPETPSFIKIVEHDTTGTALSEDQDMDGVDSDDDDDDEENEHQYDSVEGFRIPVKPKSQKTLGSVGVARMSDSDTRTLENKMSQVTLSDDQHMQSQDQTMRRTASSTSMDTRP